MVPDLDAKATYENRLRVVYKAVVGDAVELNLGQFQLAMEVFCVPLSNEATKQLFATIDHDASGGINQEEFSDAMDRVAEHLVTLIRTTVGLNRCGMLAFHRRVS